MNFLGTNVSRRGFVAASGSLALGALASCATGGWRGHDEIIDTHTHFYDPARPGGVPWPPKDDPILYRTVLPSEFRKLAEPLGVKGTVVVEASPQEEDNDWVLDLAASDKIIRGLVGHLKPGEPRFRQQLERLSRNRQFLGIRTGLWQIRIEPGKSAFVDDLKRLAERGLALDVLGGPDSLSRIGQLADAIPELRIVIDHCAGVRIDGNRPDAIWAESVRDVARRPNVHMKVSGLVEGTGIAGNAPADVEFYRPTLDVITEAFGEQRVIFGSNWPVSARFASYETVFRIVRDYFGAKGREWRVNYFARNAKRVYNYA